MSEQDNKKPNAQKKAKTPNGKNAFGEHITLGEDGTKEKPVRVVQRKKVSVSNATMKVRIPGKLVDTKEDNPTIPAAKPKEAPAKPKAIKTPKPATKRKPPAGLSSPRPKSPTKPATRKAVQPDPDKRQRKNTATSRTSIGSSTKGRVSPAKGKPAPRAKVVPPRIGTRHGYRPSLAFRLRIPVFLVAIVVCFLALFLAIRKEVGPVGRYVSSSLQKPYVELTIRAGMSAREVSLLLKEGGVVDDDRSVLQFFVDNNLATILSSGTFVMERGMDYESIGKQLTARVGELVLEVSPSFTLATIDRYLHNRGYAKAGAFLKAAQALKEEHSLSFVEGWLLSGEYVVSNEDPASSLAHAMFDSMLAVVQPHLESEQVARWGLEQTLIVASMIQAETQDVEQMPLIASVIYNRLEAGQPLGIDATTRYEIDDWENPIPKKALETQTPYNTRRKVGLPPSGICSPSKAAVEAALFPMESPYFYYLHGLDKRLHPAMTYDEHKENIKAYR